ncbi:phage holin [Bifidobacterium biavatii]|uniref:Phage lysis protein n=1 Tax=Bifidobacterium biavatii DSM 23969 TaxID=1437608 RepID=A0A087A1I8_9BIFI|nr:phage holin [Bifidobacterium biavatii]KFI52638.1 phage lysis protein [Bifidobacterium biavatii DSM 23969]
MKLTTERIKSFGVLAASLVTTVNAVLALIGWNPLPFGDTEAGVAVSLALSVGVDVWAWWRQNVVTQAAAIGHDVTANEKAAARQITADHTETAVSALVNANAAASEPVGLTDGELKAITAQWLADINAAQDKEGGTA